MNIYKNRCFLFFLAGLLFFASCQKESRKLSFNSSVEYGSFTDGRDGNTYRTLSIGNQVWFAENLQYIVENKSGHTVNHTIYGQLYTWNEAKVACPPGWHLPNIEEWNELITYLGGLEVAGGKLKETGTEHWLSPNEGANNSSGFTALPAGMYDWNSGGYKRGEWAIFWTSTEDEQEIVTTLLLKNDVEKIEINTEYPIDVLYSIRCVRN